MIISSSQQKDKFLDLNILLISTIIFISKWIISLVIFDDKNLLNKIIFEFSDLYYFGLILNFSEFNFIPNYLEDLKANDVLPTPIGSILFHSLLFKFFNISSFFILEFIFLYIFLILLVKILRICLIDYNYAVSFALVFFLLPYILGNFTVFNYNLDIIGNFFSFRVPRPLVTSCYFLWGVYLGLKYFLNDRFTYKDSLYIGIVLSLLLSSYYYSFVLLSILFGILIIKKIFLEKNYIRINYKKFLFSLSILLIFSIPFFIIYFYSNIDSLTKIGLINLNFETKLILIKYFFKKILGWYFLLSFILVYLFQELLKKFSKTNSKIITFLFLLYISSILSPFIFISLSNSVSEIYHFLNWIIIIWFFVMIIYFGIISNILIKNIFVKKEIFLKNLNIFTSSILIIVFLFFHYQILYDKNNKDLRTDYINLQNLIDDNYDDLNNLLSFSIKPQLIWLFKNKNNFLSIDSSLTSLTYNQLEYSFIKNLKFLNITSEDFEKIISNKKRSWRYDNQYVKYFSWYRYQANSLITFNASNDFTSEELTHINKSRPTLTQQIMIPRNEIKRLVNSYKNYSLDSNFIKPDLIVLDANSEISQYSNINFNNYCKIEMFKFLNVYVLITNKNICK